MSAITRERTAARRHRCSRCRQPIEPGTRYQECKLPPGGELGYQGWLLERVHLTYDDCRSQPCSWRCGRDPERTPGDLCCLCEPAATKGTTNRKGGRTVSSGYLCRCGYDADDPADLARHITSWERWEMEMTGQTTLKHFED